MKYRKSILTGLLFAAVEGLIIVVYVQGITLQAVISGGPFVVEEWHKGPVIGTLAVTFAVGFWWAERRARK